MGSKGSRALMLSTLSTLLLFLNHKTYCAQEKNPKGLVPGMFLILQNT